MTARITHGRLLQEEAIASRFLDCARRIRVYLPPSYDARPKQRYPVLYLHDGQNVFSSAGPNSCFGWGPWELDKTVDRLIGENRLKEIIMVGIDSGDSRYKELRGFVYPLRQTNRNALVTKQTKSVDNSCCEAYCNFLIKELKPKIDREYRTLKASANTGILGSSLGGICSLSLAWEYPNKFGRAGSLSGSFHIENRNFLNKALRLGNRKAKPIRIYLDSGTIDYTGDDDDRRHTDAVADQLRRLGWKDGHNLQRFTDPRPLTETELSKTGLHRGKWHEAERSQHNEFYWRQRAWRAVTFLFPPNE
jgi:predicted alpha/beta superfamily hydrolase